MNYKQFYDRISAPLRSYAKVLEGLNKLSKENQSSKYLADLNSLARFYHDVSLGVIITDNIELDSDGTTYTLTTSQVQALEKIKNEAKDPVIAKEANSILGVLKDNRAPGNFLKNIAKESQKRFGSSVYWQAEQDLSSIVTKKTLTEKEKKEESGDSNENN